jgi:hypothetical protein
MNCVLNVLLWLTSLQVGAGPVDGWAPTSVLRVNSSLAISSVVARPACQSAADFDTDVVPFAELAALPAEEDDPFEEHVLDVYPLHQSGFGLRVRRLTRFRPSEAAPSSEAFLQTLPLRC